MEIIKASAAIMFPEMCGINMLETVEAIGRVSHRSEGRIVKGESYDKFIRNVIMRKGDWSIAEHVHIHVEATVDRGISHEWVRHRIGAYTQESTRFINYAKLNTTTEECVNPVKFICPPTILGTKETVGSLIYEAWEYGRHNDEAEYITYINQGVSPEEARTCLPNALATKLVATYNLRNWRHFFLMRTTREAHPQMREVTIPLLLDFQKRIPILYEDIEPEARQSENMKKMR